MTTITSGVQMNSYAPVVSISSDGLTLEIGGINEGGFGSFTQRQYVILHVSESSDKDKIGKFGRFMITHVSGNRIVLHKTCLSVVTNADLSSVKAQLVSVPTFDNLTIEPNVTLAPPAYRTETGGGVLAIDVKGELRIKGVIDASFCGLHSEHIASHNSQTAAGYAAVSGSSHQFLGGNSGKNNEGRIGVAPSVIGNRDLMAGQMSLGGGSRYSVRGGGVIYINAGSLIIDNPECLCANGAGGVNPYSGGASGGCILINAKHLVSNINSLNYFAGATGGGGGGEMTDQKWTAIAGENGTNRIGGKGATGDNPGGAGYGPNGGGGAKVDTAGYAATATKGGNGADYKLKGWNAGAGGGGGGYIAIYTDSSLPAFTLHPTPHVASFVPFDHLFLLQEGNRIKSYDNGSWIDLGPAPATKQMFDLHGLADISAIDEDAWKNISTRSGTILAYSEVSDSIMLNVTRKNLYDPFSKSYKGTGIIETDVEIIDDHVSYLMVNADHKGCEFRFSLDNGATWHPINIGEVKDITSLFGTELKIQVELLNNESELKAISYAWA